MRAVIMAGGEGSRLRPLTCDTPKPMARLCGRPTIEYILDLLSKHQVTEAAVTVRYLSDRLREAFPDGRYKNISLSFVEETKPLGTAGSVKNAAGERAEDLLVISGDALCDIDLSQAMRFHERQK
ncbi:MAG TPA: mannose-1-phosphate guanyltransferase, partial [Ruminococcaceae bacterium]|nr:mannose-1-phosphate guanyltransferase [Oscillospiraceae bacterium]